ncbi:unnamed protein product [Microthlaspi erraticum]|uniref:Arabidopsis retrotransposon Orf1 C-terminal domain-containing protein n=1 Tax=Microthlaspi erraticum TaxID=1685480 RepID=A0A6D2HUR6_9BRAS|nr:unnamed protein product [Microthlaspi erraticum]
MCLDEESLQALFDEPLGSAQKEGEDAASKALVGEKRKNPPAQVSSAKPSQLRMTLFPTKFENGKIEYKIRLREERTTKKRKYPISSESEEGEFEIGVNIGREESDESESEEGEEVNQEVDESGHESNDDVPMEEVEPQQDEDELPMYQEHYNALFSMDFVETKYPHDKTMKALGIFKDVELVLKNMHLAQFFSHRMESYKELTCEFLASMRYHEYDELDRAELDQGWGWITFLAKGEKKMVTLRQLEILFGFTYGEGTHWDIKEDELQRVWATIAEGKYSSSRSKAAQIRSPVQRYVHKALANTFFARKATWTINE